MAGRWFAQHALARTVMTTRSGEYGSLTKRVDLSVLERDEAYQLLTSRRMPSDGNKEEHAWLLTADLGYRALALDVTASALESSVAAKPFAAFRAKLARLARSWFDSFPCAGEPGRDRQSDRS